MLKIFFSYSRRDISTVSPFSLLLKRMHYEVWFDQHSIPGGAPWKEAIQRAIAGADVMLLFCTPAAMNSEWVNFEVNIALENKVDVIPILLEQVTLPESVSPFQWIDFTAHNYIEAAFQRLINTLNGIEQRINRIPAKSQVILSYQFDDPVESVLATAIETALISVGYPLVIDDRDFRPGSRSAQRVLSEIENCHFFVCLVSQASSQSEILAEEIARAAASSKVTTLLPIRVAYRQPFAYQLRQYFDDIPWGIWDGEPDTDRILSEILSALQGGELGLATFSAKMDFIQTTGGLLQLDKQKPPAPCVDPETVARHWKMPTGTMKAESEFYVRRAGDQIIQDELRNGGATVIIKAARQMGKSSMLIRGLHHSEQLDKRHAFLDFQLLDGAMLADEQRFYKHFCSWIVRKLGLKGVTPVEDFWDPLLGNVLLCSDYLQQEILPALQGQSVVLAFDEVDTMFRCPFRSDFFGMLRNWHNNRSFDEDWELLDLLLVISTEPYSLIENPHQSPFNVGQVIALEDFTRTQLDDLNTLYERPATAGELDELHALMDGHPYLTRSALYLLATHQYNAVDLIKRAAEMDSPFKDHLSHYAILLSDRSGLANAMLALLKYGEPPAVPLANRLQSAGLVRREMDGQVVPRCKLYADYLLKTFGDILA